MITLKTGNNEKSARLVHYTDIVQNLKIFGWIGGKVGNGGRNTDDCPPHRSHDLYPGPSGVREKHFSFISFHTASEKLLVISTERNIMILVEATCPGRCSPVLQDSWLRYFLLLIKCLA